MGRLVIALIGLALVAQVGQGWRLDLLGTVAGLGSAVSAAGYFLLGEHGANRHDPFGMTAVGMLIGAGIVCIVCPPWTLPFRLIGASVNLAGWHPPAWVILGCLTVLATVVPYLAGITALRDLPPAAASTLGLIEPLVATVAAWLLLDQRLAPTQLAGGMAILTGAVLVQAGSPTKLRTESLPTAP